MDKLIFSVRQFVISNLSWFHGTRETIGEAAGRERAININKAVLKKWYPETIEDSVKQLSISSKYLGGSDANELSDTIITDNDRPIGLQGGGKNWRMGGEAIPGEYYGTLRENDLMLMMFDTDIKELTWFCIRGNKNNSFGRTDVPKDEDDAFEKILKLLGPNNASQGMWLPDFDTSVKILLQAYKIKEVTWSLLNAEKFIAQNSANISEHKSGRSLKGTSNLTFPKNRILYGAPGTGKSKQLSIDAGLEGELFTQIKRVTFYPDYTYGQFLGNYKPFPVYRKENNIIDYSSDDRNFDHEPLIDYRLVPGPLLEIISEAYLNPVNNFVLIIEEINRANVASVFGDVFQLLDRENDQTSEFYGGSSYSIAVTKEVKSFLNQRLNEDTINIAENPFGKEFLETGNIRLPANLYIWATMNSADQGVMPLDSAFKRRWSFEYLELDKGREIVDAWKVNFMGKELLWDDLRQCINDYLTSNNNFKVSEDKLLGPFFMNINELLSAESVNNKLLLYLKDDVLRHSGAGLFFEKQNNTLSKIFKAAKSDELTPDDKIKNVFCQALADKILAIASVDKESFDEEVEAPEA